MNALHNRLGAVRGRGLLAPDEGPAIRYPQLHLARYAMPRMQEPMMLGIYYLQGKNQGNDLFSCKGSCQKLIVIAKA